MLSMVDEKVAKQFTRERKVSEKGCIPSVSAVAARALALAGGCQIASRLATCPVMGKGRDKKDRNEDKISQNPRKQHRRAASSQDRKLQGSGATLKSAQDEALLDSGASTRVGVRPKHGLRAMKGQASGTRRGGNSAA